MSNSLAVAAVTSTIRHILERALAAPHAGPVGGAVVRTLRLDQLATGDLAGSPGLNLMLYQVKPNHAGNLADLPTRDRSGNLRRRPTTAIDLDYLVTAYGDESSLEGQRLLGLAIIALSATPVLSRDVIGAARSAYQGATETSFLAASDLDEQADLVKLSAVPLTLDEQTRLWGMFPQAPFQLSVAYRATVVSLEAELPTILPKPVRRAHVVVGPGLGPSLQSVGTAAPGIPATTGTELVLRGSGLVGGPASPTFVEVAGIRLAPGPGSTPNEVRVLLTGAVPAGIHGVRIVQVRVPSGPGDSPERVVATSNAVPLAVCPRVHVTLTDATLVELTAEPPLSAGQRALVRLDPATPGAATPLALSLDPIPAGGASDASVVLQRSLIPDGSWLVRLEVDGVVSVLETTEDRYTGPRLDLT